MKATLDCLECTVKQAVRAARLATDDPALQRRIVDEVARRIPALDLALSPAEVSMCAYEIAAELSGNPDPYRGAKREQNAMAMALEPELRQMVEASGDPLGTALRLAAAGNVIDLGTVKAEHIDLRAAVGRVIDEGFTVDHSADLLEALEGCDDLLFFCDNAGEIVFDRILIEQLQKRAPVTAVVKSGPILNDATLEDAEAVGLTGVCEVVGLGGAYIGCPLTRISPAFRARMDRADLILGKGQGNYETLDAYPGNVFLILKAKCDIVAEHMGVSFGEVGLISTRRRAREVSAGAY
jgi:damage-control phosphatase, subfamily I